jgi:hypothetical protein
MAFAMPSTLRATVSSHRFRSGLRFLFRSLGDPAF